MQGKHHILWWLVLAVLLVAFLWFVPQLQGKYFSQNVDPKEIPALINEYRRTWAQILGGLVLLLGLYFTWRRVEISQRTLETQQDQQVTERFTRAIDQLGATDDAGNKKLEIRLGGIYALERIAGDSLTTETAPGRDYATIMEVLTAYVRENAPRPPKTSEKDASPASDATSNGATEGNGGGDGSASSPRRRPPPDIQAILDVIGRRKEYLVPEEYRVIIDLHGADLSNAVLYEANLQRAYLSQADLSWAILSDANLSRARLYRADLSDAILSDAILEGAVLTGADLSEAILSGADLSGAELSQAVLTDAAVTQEQLATARSLKGATMPDGSTHN